MTKEQLISFEDKVKELYLNKNIKAPIHLSGNNEEQLIEIFKYISKEDYVLSTWRSHYHMLLHGVEEDKIMNDILEGRSITLFNKEHKFISSAIVGGTMPIAVGIAMGIKRNKGTNKVYCFIGDMASESGIFYEAIKYSIRNNLPIQFIIEDNGFSTNSPTQECWGLEDTFSICPAKKDDLKDWKLLNENNVGVYVHPLSDKIWYYSYEKIYPHSGAGKFVNF